MRDYRNDYERARDEAFAKRVRSRQFAGFFKSKQALVAKSEQNAPTKTAAVAGSLEAAHGGGYRAAFLGAGPLAESFVAAFDAHDDRAAGVGAGANAVRFGAAKEVAIALDDAARADMFAGAQVLRILVAGGWALIALALAGSIVANANGNTGPVPIFGLTPADAARARDWLFILAAAGALAPVASLVFGFVRGGFSGKRVDGASRSLGGAIAADLTAIRADIARTPSTARDVAELSLAGANAVSLYDMLVPDAGNDGKRSETDNRRAAYGDFLSRAARASGPPLDRPATDHGSVTGVGLALILGGALGAAGLLFFSAGARDALAASGSLSVIGAMTLALALVYSAAGALARPVAGGLAAPARRARLERSRRIVGRELKAGPAAGDIAGGIERALGASFATPVQPASDFPHSGASLRTDPPTRSSPNLAPNPSLSPATTHQPEPAPPADWRRRDSANSAPRFVDTGFQASPEPFRAGQSGEKR